MYAIRSYYDLLALDVGQFDVAVVALEHRTDLFQHFLDLADRSGQGWFAGALYCALGAGGASLCGL